MSDRDKPLLTISLPDELSAFNEHEILRWQPLLPRRDQLFASKSSVVLPDANAALNHPGRLPMPPQVLP